MEGILPHNKDGARMNESLFKYLAGIIDADGSISFIFRNSTRDKSLYSLGLKITLSSSEAVDRHSFVAGLPDAIGFGYSSNYKNPRSYSEKQFTQWTVTSRRDLEMLVPRLTKHMCVKARHLQRMLDMWRVRRGSTLSEAECDELRAFSKESRSDSGPLKPKNHPSWAWTAGYLDGNGSYKLAKYKSQRSYTCKVKAVCHSGDLQVLHFLQKGYGGFICPDGSKNCMVWERNLGISQSSFALDFLPRIVKHAKLKRHKVEQMIAFHRQQRLSDQTPAGEAIV